MKRFLLGSLISSALFLTAADISYAAKEVIITIDKNGYTPNSVEIKTGDTIIFQNDSDEERWPASNIHPTHKVYPNSGIEKCGGSNEKDIFDACRGLKKGESYRFTFLYPGNWRFHDHLRANVTGTIVVTGEAPEGASSDGQGFISRVASWVKALGSKTYYYIFPKKRDVALATLDIFKVAEDDAKLRQWLAVFGPKTLMDKLLLDAEKGANVRDCHQQAHQIGRIAYKLFGAGVFKEGNTQCNSGFYHGAMEAFLTEKGTVDIAGNVEELCSRFTTGFTTYECLHGSGHGIMAYQDYDMPSAIAECDKFSDDFGKRSCYGGVFMENIIAAQGLGAIKAHETSWVKADDMQFPCNAIGNDYGKLYECYQMQTAWMLTLTHNDFPKVVANCELAPKAMIPVCFKSLGRDIAGYTLRQGPNILSFCNLVPRKKDFYNQCVIGAVHVIVDYWGPALGSQASDFCALVTDASAKKSCDDTLEWRIKDLFGERPGA